MKAQIETIVDNAEWILGWPNAKEQIVNDMQQLMCYREAKAFLSTYKGDMWFFEVSCYLEDGGYSEPIILQAIEKVKSE